MTVDEVLIRLVALLPVVLAAWVIHYEDRRLFRLLDRTWVHPNEYKAARRRFTPIVIACFVFGLGLTCALECGITAYIFPVGVHP